MAVQKLRQRSERSSRSLYPWDGAGWLSPFYSSAPISHLQDLLSPMLFLFPQLTYFQATLTQATLDWPSGFRFGQFSSPISSPLPPSSSLPKFLHFTHSFTPLLSIPSSTNRPTSTHPSCRGQAEESHSHTFHTFILKSPAWSNTAPDLVGTFLPKSPWPNPTRNTPAS